MEEMQSGIYSDQRREWRSFLLRAEDATEKVGRQKAMAQLVKGCRCEAFWPGILWTRAGEASSGALLQTHGIQEPRPCLYRIDNLA